MKRIIGTIAVGLISLGLIGCSEADRPKTQKELARQQWNDARVGVLGGLALDQYKNGDLEKARATVDEALALSPNNVQLRLLSAKLFMEQGNLDAAGKQLAEAQKTDPKNAEADYLTGVVYQRWQQPEKALAAYDAAYQKDGNEVSYVMAKGEMLVQLNREDEALTLLQSRLSYFEHSAAIRDAVGQLLIMKKDFAKASITLREASILAPDDNTIREHQAFAFYYSKNYIEAAEQFRQLLKNDNYSQRADVMAAMGECQHQLGNLREAREDLETAAALDVHASGYWFSLARLNCDMGDFARAEVAIRRGLAVEPGSSDGYCLLGYARLKQDKLPAALSAFEKASSIDDHNTTSLCMQGYVLQKMNRPKEAMEYYSRALRVSPSDELAGRLMTSIGEGE